MTMIRFTRIVTIEEHSHWYERDDVPPELLPLFDGPSLDTSVLTIEQNDAIDELLFGMGRDELKLGDTIDSTPFTPERY